MLKTKKYMKTRLTIYSLFIFSIAILYSCKPPAYVPNKINAPMITEKNDFNADLGIGLSGINVQAAYSPVNHLGIMANFSTEAIFSKKTAKKYHKTNFGEIGAGYYLKLGKFFMFDVYGGGGLADCKIVLDSNNRDDKTNVNYYRIFAQPTIAFTSNIFKLGLSCRFNYVNSYKSSGTSSDLYKGSLLCYEPAITAKLGYKWIMFYVQWQMSMPFSTDYPEIYQLNPYDFTAGLCCSLNFGKKK